MAGYLNEGIAQAASSGAPAVVVELNTPGGSLDATQRITSALLEADVPTIVWITPSGGRAASAGTFITMAANLAYMAPGTNIGAASPVGSNGEDIPGTLGEKVKNDAIANITSIAEARGRPVEWAVSTVDEAKSYTASQAVAAGAVDGIAATIDEVLAQANGEEVTVGGVTQTLDLEGVGVEAAGMNPLQGLLHLLSDPNIAFVLFTIGLYGLIFELQNPNFVTGILGALAIILAFIGFGSLPLNLAGLMLIVLGVVLFVLEATVTSHGLLAIGGIICFALGASALYTDAGRSDGADRHGRPAPDRDQHGDHRDPHGPDHARRDPDPPHGATVGHGRQPACRSGPRASSRPRSSRWAPPISRASRGAPGPRTPARSRGTRRSASSASTASPPSSSGPRTRRRPRHCRRKAYPLREGRRPPLPTRRRHSWS